MIPPTIPIANIYYLYCYAWDRFEAGRRAAIGAESSPDLPNLLTKVLLAGTRTIVRRGLDRGYVPHVDDIPTVRGRIDLEGSIRLMTRHSTRLSCQFDELTHDVLHNQILKATLIRLARHESLAPELAHRLNEARHSFFSSVRDIRLAREHFGRVRLHRNNAFYDLLLKICRLVYEVWLPNEQAGDARFVEAIRDEREMAHVFEQFVRNFYRQEQAQFRVTRRNITWDAVTLANTGEGRLPSMQTDISLESPTRRIIIDTKFYKEALQQRREASQSFRSENLYQLFAYLKNDAALSPGEPAAEGLLIYPENGPQLDGQFVIQGHHVRIATVDLSQPWERIDARLRGLVA